MVSVARRSAVKARTQAANQINGLAVSAPEHLKDHLRGLSTRAVVEVCARWRPESSPDTVTAAAKTALRSLARRHQALTAETAQLDAELRSLCEQANPALLAAVGVGAETAAALLVAAGDNPQRMRSEASFRGAVRRLPRRGVLGPNGAPPPQPRRQPPRQQRPVAHRPHPSALRRAHHRLRRTPPAARARPNARPSAASNATSRARSIGSSPTRRRCHAATTCAANAPNAASPSTPQLRPSAPTPPASQHSNGATTTTATSPNATNNTSLRSRVDKHGSIIGTVRLAIIEDHLNTMPRKLHDWHSAHSVYTELTYNHR